jgi:hypothetical protein
LGSVRFSELFVLKSINVLKIIMMTHYVYFEVGTEFINIIQMNFVLQRIKLEMGKRVFTEIRLIHSRSPVHLTRSVL